MLKDPQNTVINFLKGFKEMPEAKRGVAILKTFGQEAGRFVLKAVANTKLLDEAMTKAGAAEALGSMDREFANILARTSTAGKRIKETFIDISRAIGTVFLGVFNKYSDRLITISGHVLEFVKAHPGIVKMAAVFGLLLVAVSAVAIPLGIIFSIISAGLPIWAALLTGIAAVSGAISLAIPLWGTYALAAATMAAPFIAIAAAIGSVSYAIHELVKNWELLTAPGFLKDLAGFSKEIGGGAWSAIKSGLGLDPAKDKAAGRAQNNKVEVTGHIGVSASGGAKVESADINLNTGYNLAVGGA